MFVLRDMHCKIDYSAYHFYTLYRAVNAIRKRNVALVGVVNGFGAFQNVVWNVVVHGAAFDQRVLRAFGAAYAGVRDFANACDGIGGITCGAVVVCAHYKDNGFGVESGPGIGAYVALDGNAGDFIVVGSKELAKNEGFEPEGDDDDNDE